ncbi:MAG: SIS domain-containing protein [Gemmatimonadaceae bacterium]
MMTPFHDHFSAHIKVVEASIEALGTSALAAGDAIAKSLLAGGKVLTFGNGGSSAEASHLAEELVGRFRKTRRPYPAICLTSDSGTVTCISNDFGYGALFERQVEAFARAGDIAVALTTSGRSENIVRGLIAARNQGAVTIALTGEAGLAGAEADHVLAVPSSDSALIQEVHLMLIHVFCEAVDAVSVYPGSDQP